MTRLLPSRFFNFNFYFHFNFLGDFWTDITSFKTFGKFFRSYSELLSKFEEISFQEYVSEGISHPVFYGDLVDKLRRVKCEANFVSASSKIVNRLWRWKHDQDPVIIYRTMCLLLGPFTALYNSFLKHCTLTNKAMGTLWRALSKPQTEETRPWSSSPLSLNIFYFHKSDEKGIGHKL